MISLNIGIGDPASGKVTEKSFDEIFVSECNGGCIWQSPMQLITKISLKLHFDFSRRLDSWANFPNLALYLSMAIPPSCGFDNLKTKGSSSDNGKSMPNAGFAHGLFSKMSIYDGIACYCCNLMLIFFHRSYVAECCGHDVNGSMISRTRCSKLVVNS